MLSSIDEYAPARAAAVRQKLTEFGMTDQRRSSLGQLSTLMQQGTSESLLTAATTAPQQMQPRIYEQAALKALAEGKADRARQIATDNLDGGSREALLRTVDFRQLADKTEATNLVEVRETVARLGSDSERINLLLRLSETAREKNRDLAVQLLDEAREFTNRRAVSYQQFLDQLAVSSAFAQLQNPRGFEILEPGIMQLNELLTAADVLSGFEVSVFRNGEMSLMGGNGLSDMVRSYGQQIGKLAKVDVERAQNLAGRFQFAESRILSRLSIVKVLLGVEDAAPYDNGRRGGFGQVRTILQEE
jgi:hypothetical protein